MRILWLCSISGVFHLRTSSLLVFSSVFLLSSLWPSVKCSHYFHVLQLCIFLLHGCRHSLSVFFSLVPSCICTVMNGSNSVSMVILNLDAFINVHLQIGTRIIKHGERAVTAMYKEYTQLEDMKVMRALKM